MTALPTKTVAYVLTYRSYDYFVIGVILVLLSAITAAITFNPLEITTRSVFFSVSIIGGLVAAYLLRTGMRYRQRQAWYLSFAPSNLRINFFDFRLSDLPLETSILDIPRSDLIWIRKTRKQGLDEADEFFVDLRVSNPMWETAKRVRTDFRAHLDPFVTPRGTGSVQFFEEDIIRVSIDGSTWPEDLADYWQRCEYPVVDDYEIGPTSTIDLVTQDAQTPPGKSS